MVNKSLPVKGRRRVLRRSLSYDTLPKMKNKHFICQPMAVPRRLTVPANELGFGITKQNMALICLALISFTAMLALAIIAPFFPTESSAKGMRESVNGLVFSVYALVYLILSPVISLIIPVVGSKLTLILGVFVAGVANILFGVLDKIDDLNMFTAFCFIVRVVEGVGGAAFSTATYTILMDEYSDNIGFAFVSASCILPLCSPLDSAEYSRDRHRTRLESRPRTRWFPLQHRWLRTSLLRAWSRHADQHTPVRGASGGHEE